MRDEWPVPPYRIVTPRLILRCYELSDAAAIREATAENREHLLPWMPWAADEPQDLEAKIRLLRRFRSRFDGDEDWAFGVFGRESGDLIGGTGFHPRCGPGGLEIGYWIDARRGGRGLATESARALTRLGFEIMKAERIEIRCDPQNHASRRIPAKLGFSHEGTLRSRIPAPDGTRRDCMVWALIASEYPASPCASAELEAFDAIGRRML